MKSILDIPKTLELLETLGVSVYGFETNEFPAFFTRVSGCKIQEVKSEQEVAKILHA